MISPAASPLHKPGSTAGGWPNSGPQPTVRPAAPTVPPAKTPSDQPNYSRTNFDSVFGRDAGKKIFNLTL